MGTMVELETLKDLVSFGVDYSLESGGKSLALVSDYDLKQEAIKWIKDIRLTTIGSGCICGNFEFPNSASDNLPETESNASTLIRWIMHFFNISEEDLE